MTNKDLQNLLKLYPDSYILKVFVVPSMCGEGGGKYPKLSLIKVEDNELILAGGLDYDL